MHTATFPRQLAAFIVSTVLVASAQWASAAPVFQVVGKGGQGPFDASSSAALSRASNASGSFTDPINGGTNGSANNAYAAAGPDGLRVDANSTVFSSYSPGGTPGQFFDRVDPGASAAMTLDDVIISGPAGTISTSYRIHLSGSLQASKQAQAEFSLGSAGVGIQLLGNGNLLNDNSAIKYSGQPQIGSGLLTNFTGSDDLNSDPFSVMANQAFAITIRLLAFANSTLDATDTGAVSAAANFSNTLTFVTNGPVFVLPVGYTANSISGNISNNQFVPAVVPLPASIWLLITAVAGLGGRRWLRRKISS